MAEAGDGDGGGAAGFLEQPHFAVEDQDQLRFDVERARGVSPLSQGQAAIGARGEQVGLFQRWLDYERSSRLFPGGQRGEWIIRMSFGSWPGTGLGETSGANGSSITAGNSGVATGVAG